MAWRRYVLTAALVTAAVILRGVLEQAFGPTSVVVFLLAIITSAWVGGIGPAILSLVVLHVVHAYRYLDPPGLLQGDAATYVSTAGYYFVGITVGALSQKRAAAQRRERLQQLATISEREQFRTTLSCMAEGVLVTDIEGRLTHMNPAAEGMTGRSLIDSIGKPWREVFVVRRDDGQEGAESGLERALGEGRILHLQAPLVLLPRAAAPLPIAYSAAPLRDVEDRVTGVVVVFRDESERRRTELALRNADQRKDEFLATLAHELRNPLSPISTGLDLLEATAGDPRSAAEVRTMMRRQTQHMVRLIDDLMDLSRITRDKLELRKDRCELADVIRDAVEAVRPLVEDARHQLTVRVPEKPLPLFADANRLTQVVTNLLNNAAKYTPAPGRIDLTAEHTGGEVVLTVSDSGIGIPADKLGQVFEMFTQIHESSESGHCGLGIGLALVKRLVEMHGGTVEATSRGTNLGATFRVRLPALSEASAAEPIEVRPRSEQGAVRRRILIVDDNADALDSLSRLVALMGNDVRQAQNGLEAIELAKSFAPDLVLMDLGMPKLNGYEAAQRMREQPWGQDLAIVATTGWGKEEDFRRTAEAGFDHHLVKPISLNALKEVLQAAAMLRG
jgi:PAS domain S-box-containing protein